MEQHEIRDRVRGSLVGGAVGDALGSEVERMNYEQIVAQYGEQGIVRYKLGDMVMLSISDDTLLALYTACGLLTAQSEGLPAAEAIRRAYIESLYANCILDSRPYNDCRITERMRYCFVRKHYRSTSYSVLKRVANGEEVIKKRIGNGAVMRVAPIALYGVQHGDKDIASLDLLAAQVAKITHDSPKDYIPSAFLCHLIYLLAGDSEPTVDDLRGYMGQSLRAVSELYPEQWHEVEMFASSVMSAVILADSDDLTDVEAIAELGMGVRSVGAVAIALYCSIRHYDSFEQAVVAAVNHSGDSVATGAITGYILGAALGYSAIPKHFTQDLESHEIIIEIADRL